MSPGINVNGSGRGRNTRSGKKFRALDSKRFVRPGIAPKLLKDEELDLSMSMSLLNINGKLPGGGDSGGGRSFDSFEEMNLDPNLLKGILSLGLEKPALIQKRAIVPCIQGRDVIMQAQSGMGKTAALVIAILQRVDKKNRECQAIILAPTRELAEQIYNVVMQLSKFMGVTVGACIGGKTKLRDDKVEFAKGRQVVVGTIGRILHMIRDSEAGPFLNVHNLITLGVDEADHIVTPEFCRDFTDILKCIPEKAQIILMSATMPKPTIKQAHKFMHNPLLLLVNQFQLTLDGIRQFYIQVEEEDKVGTLVDLFPLISKAKGMIFCSTRKRVDILANKMKEQNYNVAKIQGMIEQEGRDEIMRKFRLGTEGYRVLIASDLLGRGIDVQHVSIVINYDVTDKKRMEQYIHRVGRAGRYGRMGIAITFLTEKQMDQLRDFESFYNTSIEQLPPKNIFADLLDKAI